MNDDTRSPHSGTDRRADAARRDYVPHTDDDSVLPAGTEEVQRLLVDGFEPVEPDPTIWDRIAADISAGENPESVGAGAATGDLADGVISLDSRRRVWPALFSVAALILAVLGTVVIVDAVNGGSDTVAADAVYQLVDPDSGTLAMTVTAADDGTAVATVTALEPLDADQTYQLWSVVGEEIVSVGLLGATPGEVPLRIEGDPAVLALTVEVAGGVAVSQATPVAVWQATG